MWIYVVLLCLVPVHAPATAPRLQDADTADITPNTWKLIYRTASRTVDLHGPRGATTLEVIPENLDPAVIGAEHTIRLLPPALQPHIDRQRLLYLSTRRSSVGSPEGYCGVGTETTLNIVDIAAEPRIRSRILIASCLNRIVPAGDGDIATNLSAFSLLDGALHIRFLVHENWTDAVGVLDADRGALRLIEDDTDASTDDVADRPPQEDHRQSMLRSLPERATFQHRFTEHPDMVSVVLEATIAGDHITLVNPAASGVFPAGVIAEGTLMWHAPTGQWIIGHTAADRDADEVGGCSTGPEVVDLHARIYWMC